MTSPAGTQTSPRAGLSTAMWGIVLLIATEAALFGVLIASYFYLRIDATTWPPPGVPEPSVALPLALSGVLVAGALPVWAAVRAATDGQVRRAWALLAAATVVQAGYLGLQIHLFAHDFNDFRPTGSAYGSIYFTLLAVHHAHVAVGIALDVWLLSKLSRGLTRYRMTALRVVAAYWAFVSLVGVAVVLTVLFPSL